MDVDEDVDQDADQDDEDDDEDNAEEDDEPLSQVRRPSLPTTNTTSSEGDNNSSRVNGTGPTSHPQDPSIVRTSDSSPGRTSTSAHSPRVRYEVRPEALNATLYDIVPTMAAPQSTSINCVTATPDMRYWFTGGSDCYIRKYDGGATINGKTLLTVAQRHPFVDTVVKAGVLMSYWDNEEPASKVPGEEAPLSPVYSLAVQSQALWMLSGLESGAVNLYSVRHDEGRRLFSMQKHKSAVSVLTLAQDEKSVLSGSWDKSVIDWDLNTGQPRRTFDASGGQISAIEVRPASSLPVPEESGEPVKTNGTFSSNNDEKPLLNGSSLAGLNEITGDADGLQDAPGSPTDSLFGDGGDENSLFGETTGDNAPSGGNFGDEDDDFSRAMGLESTEQVDSQGDLTMGEPTAPAVQPPAEEKPADESLSQTNGAADTVIADEEGKPTIVPETQDAEATSDSTFLAASMDGTLHVWDRRQPNPIAKIPTKTGVPPWCMAACWSPDGNYIYAGRRNGTVEEYSLHKGLRDPDRTFKFPGGSGAVSAIRAMPNGRHLIW